MITDFSKIGHQDAGWGQRSCLRHQWDGGVLEFCLQLAYRKAMTATTALIRHKVSEPAGFQLQLWLLRHQATGNMKWLEGPVGTVMQPSDVKRYSLNGCRESIDARSFSIPGRSQEDIMTATLNRETGLKLLLRSNSEPQQPVKIRQRWESDQRRAA